MADVQLPQKLVMANDFKKELLKLHLPGKIHDILTMTMTMRVLFLKLMNSINHSNSKPLQDVGLGLRSIRQSSSTLSGGEAQKNKSSLFLGKRSDKKKDIILSL
jgi:excinuclease UvrABC ATPase subunit